RLVRGEHPDHPATASQHVTQAAPRYARSSRTSTSSPTERPDVWSAARLTPTQKPPPATSIVLPVKLTPLSEPVIRIWRRPPSSATSSGGISITASPPGLSSRQRRTRPRNDVMVRPSRSQAATRQTRADNHRAPDAELNPAGPAANLARLLA